MGNQASDLEASILSPDAKASWETCDGLGDMQNFVNSAGHTISFRVWTPVSKPIAIVFVVHGLHEHGGRYAGLAHALSRQGYMVYANDHLGHGLSAGEPGLIPNIEDVIGDTLQLVQEVSNAPSNKDLPLLFVNHSMGSMIGGRTLLQLKAEDPELAGRVKGVVVSGALIKAGKDAASPLGKEWLYFLNSWGPVMDGLSNMLAKTDPSGPAAPINTNKLTHDEGILKKLDEDELHYKGWVKNLTAQQITKGIKRLVRDLRDFDYSVLIIHGAEDSVCLPQSAEVWFQTVSSEVKEIKIYDGLYHEIMNETPDQRTTVFTDILSFMEKQLIPT